MAERPASERAVTRGAVRSGARASAWSIASSTQWSRSATFIAACLRLLSMRVPFRAGWVPHDHCLGSNKACLVAGQRRQTLQGRDEAAKRNSDTDGDRGDPAEPCDPAEIAWTSVTDRERKCGSPSRRDESEAGLLLPQRLAGPPA